MYATSRSSSSDDSRPNNGTLARSALLSIVTLAAIPTDLKEAPVTDRGDFAQTVAIVPYRGMAASLFQGGYAGFVTEIQPLRANSSERLPDADVQLEGIVRIAGVHR